MSLRTGYISRDEARDFVRAAGLPELHPYALRHSAATSMAWAGASIRDLMDFGGWTSERMPARIYVHTPADRLRDLVAAASPLRGAAGPVSPPADQIRPRPPGSALAADHG